MTKFTVLATFALLTPFAALAVYTPRSHFIKKWGLDQKGTVSLAEINDRRGNVFD